MVRFLLIDDNPNDRFLTIRELQREFSELPIEVQEVTEAICLNHVLKESRFDLVITDYRLGWSNGLMVLKEVKRLHPDCPVVMFTDSGSQEVAVEAMKLGLDDYLTKSPKHYAQLPLVIRNVFKRAQYQAEQRQTEAALQQSEERLRLALEAAHMGIWDWNLQTDQTTWTESNERLFGLAPGSFGGRYTDFLRLVHPDDRPQVTQEVSRSLKQKVGYSQEYRIIRLDGRIRWIIAKGEFIFNKAGQPIRMLGTSIDITERKQTELELQQLNDTLEQQVRERTARLEQSLEFEAMLRRITDKVRDSLDERQILETAVQELGEGLGVNSCNAALYDLNARTSTICYEYNPSIIPMKGHISRMNDFPEIYQPLLQGESVQFCNVINNPIRGRVAMLAVPMFADQGILGDLWLIVDKEYVFKEQELRLVQQVANHCAIALRQARLYQAAQTQVKELEKLNGLKDDFLNTVSHELRTPMASMKMAIRMLSLATTEERRQRYLEILKTECNREVALINDLLDLQKLETSLSPSVPSERVDLQSWLPVLLSPFETRTQEHEQQIKAHIPADLVPILVDQNRLERILTELLNNAYKYTPGQGGICFSVHSQPSADPTLITLQLSVRNQAEIPATELPNIFEKFYRIPNADPWKQGGTGLGLALVKKLVEQMGGTIEVESSNGWTAFTISFQALVA